MLRSIPIIRAIAPVPKPSHLPPHLPVRLLSTTPSTPQPAPAAASDPAAPSGPIAGATPREAAPGGGAPPARRRAAYFVARTHSNNLAVYQLRKRGGNKALTEIKKIEGDTVALADDLSAALAVPRDKVKVKPVTRHIVIDGFHREKVMASLHEWGF